MKKYFLSIPALFLTYSAIAGTSVGPVKIAKLGCHIDSDVCYVNIEGAAVGPSACQSASIRWDAKNDKNSEKAFSILLSAHMTNRSVNLYLKDSCFTLSPNYPTFHFLNVE